MQITDLDRGLAAEAARPRTERQTRGTGRYRVTVGGYVVGFVEKIASDAWLAFVEQPHGERVLDETFRTRKAAVHALGATDEAAESYQEAAFRGAFGFEEQRRVQKAMDAFHAALDGRDVEPQPTQVKMRRVGGQIVFDELLEDIDPGALHPGDRIVGIDDEHLDDGPIVAEKPGPLYGDHGPFAVRLVGAPTHASFLYLDNIKRFTVWRTHS